MRALRSLAHRADLRVIAVVLIAKLALLTFGVAAIHVIQDRRLSNATELLSLWNHWDAPHYLFLAEHGYQASGDQRWFLAFFPLYPWLVRIVAPLTSSYLAAALLVSTICTFALAVLLRRLAERDYPGRGEGAVWFLLIFPTAYFLHVGYTEGLFLTLTVGAFLAARDDRWWLAGVLGLLAGLTRINALVLVPALALEAWQAQRREGRWQWRYLWPGLTLLGLAAYLYLNYRVGGHPFRFLEYQGTHWYRGMAWPWVGLAESWRAMLYRTPAEAFMLGVQEPLFVLLGLAATIYSWLRQRPAYAVWMTGNWLLFACQSYVFGVPRFTLTLFPLFLMLAQTARHRVWLAALTVWCLLFQALFASQYVQGRWTF